MDTVRSDHLGCYGYERNTSPRIDAFANSASRYDPTSGVEAILAHTQQFRHGNRDLDPGLGIVTVNEMAAEKVSRRGCWSSFR
jgi:hypothetical protein